MQGRIISGFSASLDLEFSLSLILLNVASEKRALGKRVLSSYGDKPQRRNNPFKIECLELKPDLKRRQAWLPLLMSLK